MHTLRSIVKAILPESLYTKLLPVYHYVLALVGALRYFFPSRKIIIIGVTGTKGKSTVLELVNTILEEAGHKTALAGTVRFKVGDQEQRNMLKMTMPGRFFVQKWLRDAVDAGCTYAILEMTSEGVKQSRHKFLSLDALIFTNLTPEHIESHGSYENYVDAKLAIAQALADSKKKNRALIVNSDSKEAEKFLAVDVPTKIKYSLHHAQPISRRKTGLEYNFRGTNIKSQLPGTFNIYNTLAALTCTTHFGVDVGVAARALAKFEGVRGRMEFVETGKDFDVVVDYAHTADSLQNAYDVFKEKRLICVLGGTGGGRDVWKRKLMGSIADNCCEHIFLTDEDPYDEDPKQIVADVKEGVRHTQCETVMDRRKAIAAAMKCASTGDVVIITGKGTDPFIMGPDGTKTPWDDAEVVREEAAKL
jgi:UDP-N-acetylmuramoyl-L-alanyl-D-glutamate--2,6-diaminopimelate ligase